MVPLEFVDSVMRYGTNTSNYTSQALGNNVMARVQEKWGVASNGKAILSPGRWGNGSYSLNLESDAGAASSLNLKLKRGYDTLCFGFAYKPSSVPTPVADPSTDGMWITFSVNSSEIYGVGLVSDDNVTKFKFYNKPAGAWEAGDDIKLRASFNTSTWYYIEILVVTKIVNSLSLTPGIYVKVNGKQIYSTQSLIYTNANLNKITINPLFKVGGSGAAPGYYTDFYAAQNYIPYANTSRIWVPTCTGDGSLTEWNTSSGTVHYTLVDETVRDSSDYIYTEVSGKRDLYKFDEPTPLTNIHAVAINAGAEYDTFGQPAIQEEATRIQGIYRNIAGGTVYAFSGQVIPETSYRVHQHILTYNPVGTSVWLESDFTSGHLGIQSYNTYIYSPPMA